ncbi:MAG: hypothetical protein IJY66_03720, partial [Clostridia bacterium]|nr:hypothetical protein [Clostridia bacterium]
MVGGSYEANTAVDNVVDLNEDAKGAYIYTYVTRDLGYGAPLTAMTVNESSSKSGWITGTNTSGNVIDLNQGAGGDYIYLHYQRATALNPKVTFYTIVDGDFTTTLDNVTTTVYDNYNKFTPKFDFVKNPTAGGLTYRFVGWREDSEALAPTVTTVSLTADQCPKYYRGIYTNTVTLTFDANGGTGAPGSVSGTQYVSTDTGGAVPPGSTLRFYPFKHGGVSIKIPTQVPVKSGACEFSHWNRSGDGKDLKPGETITWYFPSTLTAAYKDHSYTDNICTVCGMINPAITPAVTLSKNDKVVGLYTTLADAITSAQSCTAADKAVVKLLKDIDLGNTSQSIRGGVFTLDLNGKLLSSTRDTWDVLQIRDGAQLTIDDSGIGGTIQLETGTAVYIYDGDLTLNGGTLTGINGVVISDNSGATINGGTVIGDSYAVNIKVGGAVTITGGSFTGGNYADIVNWGTVTLSGGTFPGGIKLENATLNAVLGNGYAYWQGDTMILPANDAKQITGGDVTVKTACPHKNGIKQNYI